jgi:hypothetical protein
LPLICGSISAIFKIFTATTYYDVCICYPLRVVGNKGSSVVCGYIATHRNSRRFRVFFLRVYYNFLKTKEYYLPALSDQCWIIFFIKWQVYIVTLRRGRGGASNDKFYQHCHIWSYIHYSLDSASNYSTIQKLKPWLQTQDIPMKWETYSKYIFKLFKLWKLLLFFKRLLASGKYQHGRHLFKWTAGIFLASILLKEMRYLVYIRYLWALHTAFL